MRTNHLIIAALLASTALWFAACEEGTEDWNSSAVVEGHVFTDPSHSRGLTGVSVVIEADPDAENPYEGPDRWTTTNPEGHFECGIFLGNVNGDYNYVADLSVGYFWRNKFFRWTGGITVGPGTRYTLPAVDTTMFEPISGN